jgi:aminoglycoside phosphotransferase (APT) family kinase protein
MGSEVIVRVPLDPVNEERVARNFSGLNSAQAVAAACTGFGVPRPLLNDAYRGVRYTVESFVSGTPYAKLEPEQRNRCDRRIIDLLIEFNSYQDPDHEPVSATEVWRRVVVEPLRALIECFPDPADRRIGVALLEFAANDGGRPLPTAFMHGDFASGNILFDSRDDRLSLIDWDRWAAQDFVTQDFLHFICYRRILLTGCKWLGAFEGWLNGDGADRIEAEATDRFVERLALPAGWRLRAGLAYWVREVNSHHPSKLKLDFDWAQRILRGAMPALLKHFTATARVG